MGKLFQNKAVIIGVSCLVFLCLIATAFFALKGLMKDDGGKQKRHVAQIKMLKPPPPPKIKEKPPEPEIRKKEEIVEPEPEEQVEEELDDAMDDDLPPGEELGLDADGTGGADGFGLKAKKGGRSLIGGDGSGKSLLRRYAWYTRILQDEIREKVNKIPRGKGQYPGREA